MKKLLCIGMFMALLTTVKSQLSVEIPVGVSTLKVPTIGLNFKYQINRLFLASGFDHHVSAKRVNGTFYWARLGAAFKLTELNSLELSSGFGSHQRSSDVKSMNVGLALLNAQFVHTMKFHPEASVFGSVTGTKNFVIFSGGLRLTFLGRERSGCPSSRVR